MDWITMREGAGKIFNIYFHNLGVDRSSVNILFIDYTSIDKIQSVIT